MASALILGCLKVFFCRILDVTLGSLRTVLVVKEKTVLAALAGFFEVFIWYIIVRDALNFTGPVLPIAFSYAAGYASGTYLGGTLAKKLVGGHVTVHVVTTKRAPALPEALRKAGFVITVLDVNGSEYGEARNMILADLDKNRLAAFRALVTGEDPGAFLLIQETKQTLRGVRRPGK